MSSAETRPAAARRPGDRWPIGRGSGLLFGAALGLVAAVAKLPVDFVAGGDVGLLPLVLGVGLATWYGNRVAGIAATIGSAAMYTYLVSAQPGSPALAAPQHWTGVLLYVVVGVAAVIVVAGLHDAREREAATAAARDALNRALAEREDRLAAMLERERQAKRRRDAFIDIVSHELRTPITLLVGSARLLRRSGRELGEDERELVGGIEAGAERLARLVEDLVVLVRSEREAIPAVDEPVRLRPVLERVVGAEAELWPDVPFELVVDDPLPIVRGAEAYLEQVLGNLLSNGAKYNSAGGRVQVLASRAADGGATVRVLDDGPGIVEAEADRLFDLFYRSGSTARSASGSGIGLYVCRRLVEAMGGEIGARRRPEGGSEFYVNLLPYAVESEIEAEAEEGSEVLPVSEPGPRAAAMRDPVRRDAPGRGEPGREVGTAARDAATVGEPGS